MEMLFATLNLSAQSTNHFAGLSRVGVLVTVQPLQQRVDFCHDLQIGRFDFLFDAARKTVKFRFNIAQPVREITLIDLFLCVEVSFERAQA